jgi:hypothetical protein
MIDFIMEHEFNFNRKAKPLSKIYGDICQVLAMGNRFEARHDPEVAEMNRQVCLGGNLQVYL